jgi:hypothetical protein
MTPRVLEIVRHFRENGLKLLLQHHANARDLLALTGTRLLDRIDFARMTVDAGLLPDSWSARSGSVVLLRL